MALNPNELLILRNDLGAFGAAPGGTGTVYFTDAVLESNVERVGGKENWNAAIGLCVRQLMMGHARNVDSDGAEISVKGSQVMYHLRQMWAIFGPALRRVEDIIPPSVLISEVAPREAIALGPDDNVARPPNRVSPYV